YGFRPVPSSSNNSCFPSRIPDTRSITPFTFNKLKLFSITEADFMESSKNKISPFSIDGIYLLPQKPNRVFKFPPINFPFASPSFTQIQSFVRCSFSLSLTSQFTGSSDQYGGIGIAKGTCCFSTKISRKCSYVYFRKGSCSPSEGTRAGP